MIRASALLLLVTACAGSPVEAAAVDGDGSGGASSTDHGGASTAAGTTAGTNVDGGSDPSGAASGDATDPASTDPTSDATASDATASDATTSDASETTGDPSAESSSTASNDDSSSSGEPLGGCLGDPLPEVDPAECSISDATEAQLSIDNTCDFDVEVFWVAYDCAEQSYQVISGGNDWSIQSFATHPWRIRAAEGGALLVEIPPLRGDTQITVE